MPYGILKCDTITFTSSGVDKSVSISGLVQNPTFSGNITSTGTISGVTIQGGTLVSGATVTGSAGQFTTLVASTASFTTVTGVTSASAGGFIPTSSTVPTNGVYLPSANNVGIATNSTSRLIIDNNGNVNIDSGTFYVDAANNRVGVGTSSPEVVLNSAVSSASTVYRGAHSNTGIDLYVDDSTGEARISASRLGGSGGKFLSIYTDTGSLASERLRVDPSGRLLVGTSISITSAVQPFLQVHGTGESAYGSFGRWSADGNGPGLLFAKSRGGAVGTRGAVTNNDLIGEIAFYGDNGTTFSSCARITGEIDGVVSGGGATDMPGRLVFSTSADGTASNTEQLRITNDGVCAYNQAAPAAIDATATATIANLKTGLITSSTAAAVSITLPTGTNCDGGFSGVYTNLTFEWSVINTGATNAVTILGNTGHTIVGSATVAASNSGRFASRRTGVNTWVTYRLSS